MPRIVKYQLAGRLGNQLFQWAFAHRIALENGHAVQFTVDRFHHPRGLAEYELIDLACDHILNPKKFDAFGAILIILDKLQNKGNSLVRISRNRIYRELENQPSPEEILGKTSFVTGYFIHKSNVEAVAKEVSTEFCKALEGLFNRKWEDKLPEKYEVVHIRKGDFKFHKETYGILSNQYYLGAVQKKLPLVVLTDYREESAELIAELNPSYIFDISNSTAWDALAIMSRAKILHLSNSTLSWWGGFAASEYGNTVLLPSPFFKSLNLQESNERFKLDKFQTTPSSFK